VEFIFFAEAGLALMPIIFFLGALIYLDSFKLVNAKNLAIAITVGCITAAAAFLLNTVLLRLTGTGIEILSRYGAPVTEEILKFLFIYYIIRAKKVGFMVDAAIFGFAVGAGFSIVENIFYLGALHEPGLLTWLIRGLGTAVMHGGTTAIAAIITKDIHDTKKWSHWLKPLPGLLAAILIHGIYNQFILPPLTSMLLILLTLPPLIYIIFKRSEMHTRNWLGQGLDHDVELLQLIMAGDFSESRPGQYLESLRNLFGGPVMADLLGYLRVYLELSLKAKGILMLKECGIMPDADDELNGQLTELTFLEKSIGITGKLALQPLLKLDDRDIWQLRMLQSV
jgi:protease PrsW